MRRAILTIDDAPTPATLGILEHLALRGVGAAFFCIGERLERYPSIADRILLEGHVVANHGHTHRRFSQLGMEDCLAELERADQAIEHLHLRNGLPRPCKLFRFPYGDKGGPNGEPLQKELARRGFTNVHRLGIDYPWFRDAALDRARDIFWTFDCLDYRITSGEPRLSPADILRHLDDPSPATGGSLASGTSDEIILMHDNPATEERFPGYHATLVDAILAKGITFLDPRCSTGLL